MAALASHSTPTVDQAWDGPRNKARLRNDETAAYYRKAYAWVDPEGDADVKASYKFIHHQVAEDGGIGAANVRGAIATVAILNGARGGTTIPDADRRGVYNHVARHIRDADMEPPELRSYPPTGQDEVRFLADSELRVGAPDAESSNQIAGYAAVFDKPSEEMFFGTEIIRQGAFAKTLKEADVRALWNHDPNYVLGRVSAGTLRLKEDAKGLLYEIDPPDTEWARGLMVSIGRGDVRESSFTFRVVKDREEKTESDLWIRELLEVKLRDVSPVTFPAYPQTQVDLRCLRIFEQSGLEPEALAQALALGDLPPEVRFARIARASEILLSRLEPGPGSHSEPEISKLKAFRRRLRLAEAEV